MKEILMLLLLINLKTVSGQRHSTSYTGFSKNISCSGISNENKNSRLSICFFNSALTAKIDFKNNFHPEILTTKIDRKKTVLPLTYQSLCFTFSSINFNLQFDFASTFFILIQKNKQFQFLNNQSI